MTSDLLTPARSGEFGRLLRTLREAAGLTQEELAERAGLTSYAVSALERGRRQRPYPHTVRSLVEALGASDAERAVLLRSLPSRAGSAGPAAKVSEQPRPAAPPAAPGLLGRDEELAALSALLLSDRRLVTLTGTGGVGKTRLALTVAAQIAPHFPDGAVTVALAPLSDPSGVVPALARAVDSARVEGPEAAHALAEHLRPLRLLVVLDNLEHLLESADQVSALVDACPRLVVVVTSRAPLRVRGETEFPVQPLAVPPAAATSVQDVAACPAAAVFVERARAVSPGFEVTPTNAAAVSALCRRLAGLPLALELAAARTRFLPPQALLARLDDAMARGGGPDLPPRQQTMRATFDWSYDLLAPAEQALLRVLSVFSGGATLDAVEEVSRAGGEIGPVVPLLEVLVEHSLVVVTTDADGEPRFGLLEPVAEYARSRSSPQEQRTLRDAHAATFLRFAERAAPEYQAADQVIWLDRAERDDANLTAAFDWALERGDGDTAGRMGWALWLFWWLRGRLVVGRRLTRAALDLDMPADVRTHASLTFACMAFALGDLDDAGAGWRAAVDLAQQGDDEIAKGQAAAGVGLVELARGDLTAAEQRFTGALPHLAAEDVYADWLQSLVWVWLGTVHMLRGDLDAAHDWASKGLASARRRGDRLTAYVALYNLSQAAIAQGRHARARHHLHEGIRLTEQTGDLANLAYVLEALTVVEAASGRASRAAVLVGAAEAVRESAGAQVYGYYKPDEALRAQAAADAEAALGKDAYGDAVDAGRSLTPAEAMAYALDDADAPPLA